MWNNVEHAKDTICVKDTYRLYGFHLRMMSIPIFIAHHAYQEYYRQWKHNVLSHIAQWKWTNNEKCKVVVHFKLQNEGHSILNGHWQCGKHVSLRNFLWKPIFCTSVPQSSVPELPILMIISVVRKWKSGWSAMS